MKDEITYYISIIEKPLFVTPGIVATSNAIVPGMIKKLVKHQGWTSFIESETEIKTYENGTTITTLYFRSYEDLRSARKAFPLDTWTTQSGELTTADC